MSRQGSKLKNVHVDINADHNENVNTLTNSINTGNKNKAIISNSNISKSPLLISKKKSVIRDTSPLISTSANNFIVNKDNGRFSTIINPNNNYKGSVIKSTISPPKKLTSKDVIDLKSTIYKSNKGTILLNTKNELTNSITNVITKEKPNIKGFQIKNFNEIIKEGNIRQLIHSDRPGNIKSEILIRK
jgi:hypothetical protein